MGERFVLKHIQMRLYLDNKYTIDFYCNFKENDLNIVSNEYFSTINKINVYNPNSKGLKPYIFKITYCENCSQMILTNRQEGAAFKCVNCNKESHVCSCKSSKELEIVKSFEDSVGITCTSLDGFTGYLLLCPFDANEYEICNIQKILESQNFVKESKDITIYKFLFLQLFNHNMIVKSISPSSVLFFSTKFNSNDYEYNNSIEKIDLALESVNKINKNTMSASISVSPQEATDKFVTATDSSIMKLLEKTVDEDYLNIDAQIILAHQYIKSGRFEDAYEILITVLNIAPDNVEAKYALAFLQCAMEGQNLPEMEVDSVDVTTHENSYQNDSPKYIFSDPLEKKERYVEALKNKLGK